MTDYYISRKTGTGGELTDKSTLHIGTSSTSTDTVELRFTTTATKMSRAHVLEAIEDFKRVLIQGSLHGTKLPIA